MNKRGLLSILFAFFLLVLPSVMAEITISGPEQTMFNFGDALVITGTMLETSDQSGFLKFELSCQETDILATKAMTLRANVQRTFAETFTIPQSLTGSSCAMHVFFETNGQVITEASSTTFTVTNALNAPITLDKESAQLGETIKLAGTITNMNGKAIDGIAKIYFKQGENIVVQDTITIVKGKFAYAFATEDNPAGKYEVTIDITDINNNKQTVVLNNLELLGTIGLIITLNDDEFLPGEKIKIDGTARTGDSRVTTGKAYITFDNANREEVSIVLGKLGVLGHAITLPTDIKTGQHTITIDVEDTHGNKETQQFTITVLAVPTRVDMIINQESFMPERQVVIQSTLYDQGDDIINAEITVDVYDAEKDIVFTDVIASARQTQFTLPRSAAPGFWKVKAASMEKELVMSFKVEDFKVLEITQEDATLLFANTGNVPIKETLAITVTDSANTEKTKTKEKTITLGVGATKAYDLAYMIGKGIYTVQVGDKIFENVTVEKRKWNVMPYFAGLLAIIILYLLLNLWMKRQSSPHKVQHHQSHHSLIKPAQQHVPKQQPLVRNRSEEWYEQKLKKDLAERMEEQRPKVQFSFSKKKNEYVEGLRKKRKSADMAQPWVRKPIKQAQAEPEVFTNSQEFSDPWKTTEEPKKEEEKKKGGSLMGMFD